MSISPRNLVLVLLLGGLVAANVLLAGPPREAAAVEALFPGFDPAAVARIEIAAPGDGAPEVLELRRGEQGWSLPAHQDFPAHAPAVDDLLARVANLSNVDRLGTEAGSHALFGVDGDEGHRVRLAGEDGTVLAEFRQGAAPEGAAGSFVRPLPGDAVYRSADLSPVLPTVGRWIDTHLVPIDPRHAQGLVARIPGPDLGEPLSIELVRLEDGRWRAVDIAPSEEPEYLAPTVLEPLFRALESLYFRDIASQAEGAAPAAGLDPAHLLVELEGEEGDVTSIAFGADAGDDLRFATVPQWPAHWVVTLPGASVARVASALRHIARARR